ncbi:MAG: MFS transporter [Acidothermales bacterium]|nr:MFS transporter [Acidothermales bacterium]
MTTVDVPSALREPTAPAGRRWVGLWTLANLGLYMVIYAAMQVLLPRQAGAAPRIAAFGKELAVSYATIAAAVVTVVVSVVVGMLSDRTLARSGRRQVWVLGGAVVSAAALACLGPQRTVVGFVAVWAVTQIGLSTVGTALTAAVPDQVPVSGRARVSAWYGVAQSAGPLLGIVVVGAVILGVVPGYLALGAFVLVLVVPFALLTRGIALRRDERPPLAPRRVLAEIVRPLRHADFSWAFSGRFFIQLSNALAQLYLYFYLSDRVHTNPDTGTVYLVLVYTACVVVAAIPTGIVSDRTGKRRRMVIVSSVLQGAAGLLLAFVPTMPAALVGAAVLGLGYGSYVAVDQALVTQVLPRATDRGKDLGVINIANFLPYALAPAIGGPLIAGLGDVVGYTVLYLLVLVTAVVAAVTVLPIKTVP